MIKPTTLFIGDKAHRLMKELAAENGMASKYFFTKMLIREAKSEATMLTADRLRERLKLIDEVNDELVELINNPPKTQLADRDFSKRPKSIYAKVWAAHKRLAKMGASEGEIHEYCLDRYGMDFDIMETPTKSPKKNPDWVGGGAVAEKIKKAKQISVELKDEE